MPSDLMKTSLFSEEWCEGSNPHTAAPNRLWLDRPEANPLHRTCESPPVSCSLLLLAAASVVPCALCSSLCPAGQDCFPVVASSARTRHGAVSQGPREGSPGAFQGSVPTAAWYSWHQGPTVHSQSLCLERCSSTTLCWGCSFQPKYLIEIL